MKTKITKKMIASLGFQRAYKRAYRRGVNEGKRDSIALAQFILQNKEWASYVSVGEAHNTSGQTVRVVFYISPKV